jgi:hypothetical protein
VDFLLECIGFPPDAPPDELAEQIRAQGEPTPYRGPGGEHHRLHLTGGLEVRADREADEAHWSVWPFYRSNHRLRVAVIELHREPDSPFDVLLFGRANPRAPEESMIEDESVPLCTWLTDARRLPRRVPAGHVLAVSIAGFALDVSYVGPNDGVQDEGILDQPCGAYLEPLGGEDSPGGCMEVSLRVRRLRHGTNPLTGEEVELLECDTPGRPLELFVSRWQLEQSGLPQPRPGWRIEGVFLFTGRLAGGIPRVRPRRGGAFG